MFESMKKALENNVISLSDDMKNFKINTSVYDLLKTGVQAYEQQEFVVFDVESNGFSDEIIEIGAIIVKNNKIKNKDGKFYDYMYYIEKNGLKRNEMDMFSCFIVPKSGAVPPLITELTHIDMDMILNGLKSDAKEPNKTIPDFATAFNNFIDYIGNRPIIAHNASFDTRTFKWSINFHSVDLNNAIANPNHGLTIEKIRNFLKLPVIDTYADAKKIFHVNPNKDHKNSTLSNFFKLESNENLLHRACYDVIFTARNFYGIYEYAYNQLSDIAQYDITVSSD